MRSSRAGQTVLRMPSAMARGVMAKAVFARQLDGGGDGQRNVAMLMGAGKRRIDANRGAESLNAIGAIRVHVRGRHI